MASSVSWMPAVIGPASSAPPNSEMSAPAAKIRSPPVMTTAPRRIRVQRRRGLAELGQQRLGEGVDLAVGQRDDGDAVVATIEVEQLCHGPSLAHRRSVLGNRPERADLEGQNGVDSTSPRSPPRESVRALLQLMAGSTASPRRRSPGRSASAGGSSGDCSPTARCSRRAPACSPSGGAPLTFERRAMAAALSPGRRVRVPRRRGPPAPTRRLRPSRRRRRPRRQGRQPAPTAGYRRAPTARRHRRARRRGHGHPGPVDRRHARPAGAGGGHRADGTGARRRPCASAPIPTSCAVSPRPGASEAAPGRPPCSCCSANESTHGCRAAGSSA